jgi:hypothetical protein
MENFDWQSVAVASICVLGLIEWTKGFVTKAGKSIGGNILRILQLVLSIGLAVVVQYLPVFVTSGLTILSLTTICKTQIMDFVQNKFGANSIKLDSKVVEEVNKKLDNTEAK